MIELRWHGTEAGAFLLRPFLEHPPRGVRPLIY